MRVVIIQMSSLHSLRKEITLITIKVQGPVVMEKLKNNLKYSNNCNSITLRIASQLWTKYSLWGSISQVIKMKISSMPTLIRDCF